ncbi:MAG: GNAT family N-acetyltransferase [Bacteroidaceae bacterium]|nr:GNAT family N-acetyltransferase [Bacteroidaceae bacterium]
MMKISRLTTCSDSEFSQIEKLINVLSTSCKANRKVVAEIMENKDTYLFVIRDDANNIVGMTTVCCFTIPTGRHASIEDVVILPEYQGIGLGRKLVQHALETLKATRLQYKVGLTSKPARIAANALYRSMGFVQKETNVYTLEI